MIHGRNFLIFKILLIAIKILLIAIGTFKNCTFTYP